MRGKQSKLAPYRLRTDDGREAVPAPTTSELYSRSLVRLPSSLRKPSLRTHFDWDDSGNVDYATRPVIADLFSGAGGAAFGLFQSGFRVVGFDIAPQPNYPFEFHQQDALTVDLSGFDAVWASPPCQWGIWASKRWRNAGRQYPDLVTTTRELLIASGKPYIIEQPAPRSLHSPIKLCGRAFGLGVIRHRYFETQPALLWAADAKGCSGAIHRGEAYTVAGHGGQSKSYRVADWRKAMGIDWMTRKELTQAIPPAYSEYLGDQLKAMLNGSETHRTTRERDVRRQSSVTP